MFYKYDISNADNFNYDKSLVITCLNIENTQTRVITVITTFKDIDSAAFVIIDKWLEHLLDIHTKELVFMAIIVIAFFIILVGKIFKHISCRK